MPVNEPRLRLFFQCFRFGSFPPQPDPVPRINGMKVQVDRQLLYYSITNSSNLRAARRFFAPPSLSRWRPDFALPRNKQSLAPHRTGHHPVGWSRWKRDFHHAVQQAKNHPLHRDEPGGGGLRHRWLVVQNQLTTGTRPVGSLPSPLVPAAGWVNADQSVIVTDHRAAIRIVARQLRYHASSHRTASHRCEF